MRRDQIDHLTQAQTVERDVPGVGLVTIRRLPFGRALALRDLGEDPVRGSAELLRSCLVMDEGEPEITADDVAAMPYTVVDALTTACMDVNGMGADAVEEAKGN